MDINELKTLSEVAGTIANPNNTKEEALLLAVLQDVREGKDLEKKLARFNRYVKKGYITSDSLRAKSAELVERKRARDTRKKVTFDSHDDLLRARESMDIGKYWLEDRKITAYVYG